MMYVLKPKLYNQKSYYDKALMEKIGDTLTLYSYGVDMISIYNGKVISLNKNPENYTQTTLKHIKDFLYQYLGLTGLTKKDILKMRHER